MSTDSRSAPDATLYRLSMYHCYLGELIRTGAPPRITSRELAEELNVKEVALEALTRPSQLRQR